jgi:hypothetical protein
MQGGKKQNLSLFGRKPEITGEITEVLNTA